MSKSLKDYKNEITQLKVHRSKLLKTIIERDVEIKRLNDEIESDDLAIEVGSLGNRLGDCQLKLEEALKVSEYWKQRLEEVEDFMQKMGRGGEIKPKSQTNETICANSSSPPYLGSRIPK